jgi:hypothetical protein
MTSDDFGSHSPGGAGGGNPLVLELVIASTEPLSGTVGSADSAHRLAFQGWIDLMSAISTLGASHEADRPLSG